MTLHGRSIVGGEPVTKENHGGVFRAFEPMRGRELEPDFYEATIALVDDALAQAAAAFHLYRRKPATDRADFLEAIATEIEALGEDLIARASAETGLPAERLTGERSRTVGQLRLFAAVVREGAWVEATIDRALPNRAPLPRPDLRRMLIPFGPVAVFGASNFPLAFSVAGGDTASALAAGNPVIVKAHPAHPGTSEIVAHAIVSAAHRTKMPAGIFALLQGHSPALSLALVEHKLTAAVGFTGSQRVGRALYDAAARRDTPIPVYAEMGSTNPVFVLPNALRERGAGIAAGLKQSITLGTGQFCTNPGLVFGLRNADLDAFGERVGQLIAAHPPGTMLNKNILRAYEEGIARLENQKALRSTASPQTAQAERTEAVARVFTTDAATFLAEPHLSEEIFGPASLIVACRDAKELEQVAGDLHGHLTATIHATPEDLEEFAWLVALLENKVGRLLLNGYPTGVEVSAAMQHGGPYPATTDVRSTSVGVYAIKRFARPVCYQNFPSEALPMELRDANERGIWRLVDQEWTKDAL